VIAQVEDIVENGTLDPKHVKVPGILVDYIVKGTPENHWQTYMDPYKPELSGQIKKPLNALEPMPLNARKVVSRRAAMELHDDSIVNLGIGMPEGVANVANEEGIQGLQLTVEAGNIGGVPSSGVGFGSATNPDCTIDSPAMFDFYDGGGLNQCFLGLAECDPKGNINVSRCGPRIAGCGGFINISQSTPVVVFCGTFTAKGLKEKIGDGKLEILEEGKVKKFIKDLEQVTFSADFAKKSGQKVLYITERAVFELRDGVFTLTEIAPGIDLQKDILEHIRSVDIDNDLIVKLLKYDLLVHNKDISEINNVSEGIDNRIRDTLSLCKSGYGEFLSSVKTKRYTMARIKRILLSILLDIKKSVLHSIDSLDYITVLAVKRDRLHLLKDAKVKLVTKYKDYAATSHVFKEIDLKANSLYNVISSDSIDSHSMIIID